MSRLWLFVALSVTSASCTTVASGPSWVGGTLADDAPMRFAREEADLQRQAREVISEPKSIGAKHVLIMHKDSERKPPGVTRTREEAKARAEEAYAKLKAGADFDQVVINYSDEPGAVERLGDVGVFEKKVMVKSFADTAFKLEVGKISTIVETPFGFHIIKRTQ